MPQTLTDIKALLRAHDLRPKKKLGQCFLHDHHHLQRVVEAAQVQPGELIVEIGPGTGTLSEQLLEAGGQLIAVEIDVELQPLLHHRLGDRATLIFADVLAAKHELNPVWLDAVGDRPFKLIANLPYNVAAPLLVNLALDVDRMSLAVVMVQREVADRLTAVPGAGGKDYGPLGIVIAATCRVQRLATLSPSCFWPQPKVDSALIRIERRSEPLTDNPHKLAALVHRLFSQRRKQLRRILGPNAVLPDGIDPAARPEQLDLEQLIQLAGITG